MKKLRSFTLVESLFSLLLLSLLLLLFQGALKQFAFYKTTTFQNHQEDFHIFLMQLEFELSELKFLENKDHSILMEDSEEKKAFFQMYEEMIRKNHNGGHHPLLLQVKNWWVKKEKFGFQIKVEFMNSQTYEGFVFYEF